MAAGSDAGGARTLNAHRTCARVGCTATVKKPTAKYCSIRCCAIDPERHERLRNQSRHAPGAPVALSRQLTLGIQPGLFDPEAQLAVLCDGREDIPAGMSRLAG